MERSALQLATLSHAAVYRCTSSIAFLRVVPSHWPFQGAQEHRRSRDLKTAGGPFLLTAVEFVPGSSDVTVLV